VAAHVRANGDVLCAAMHEAREDDLFYIDDHQHYLLGVEWGILVSEPMEPDPANPGRGGHKAHGQWWWIGSVPDDVVLEERR